MIRKLRVAATPSSTECAHSKPNTGHQQGLPQLQESSAQHQQLCYPETSQCCWQTLHISCPNWLCWAMQQTHQFDPTPPNSQPHRPATCQEQFRTSIRWQQSTYKIQTCHKISSRRLPDHKCTQLHYMPAVWLFGVDEPTRHSKPVLAEQLIAMRPVC